MAEHMSKQGLGSSQVDGDVTNGGGVVDERHHTLHYKAGILKQKTIEKEANVRARNEEILSSIKKKEEEFKKTKTVVVSESHEKSESEIIEVKKLEKSNGGSPEAVVKLPFGDVTKSSNGPTEEDGPNDDEKVNPFGDEKAVDSKKLEKSSDDEVDGNCASDDDETLKEDKKTNKLDLNGSTDDAKVVNGQNVKVKISTIPSL